MLDPSCKDQLFIKFFMPKIKSWQKRKVKIDKKPLASRAKQYQRHYKEKYVPSGLCEVKEHALRPIRKPLEASDHIKSKRKDK